VARPRIKANRKATIFIDDLTGRIALRTPYDTDFLDEFRGVVPRDNRTWDKPAKLWYVDIHFLDQLVALCERYFEVEVPPQMVEGSGNGDCYEMFLKHVSKDCISKIWRIVARELHPDMGGDKEKFVEAKQGYEEIVK